MSERVLLVRLSSLGDVVHAVPAAAGLARARPDLSLSWVVQSEWAPLLRGLPFLQEVVPFDRGGGVRALLRVRRELRHIDPAVALDLQGNWKSALLAFLSGARRRIGPRLRRERGSALLLNARAAQAPGPHATESALSVVRELAPRASAAEVTISPTPQEEERERAALRAAGVVPRLPFLVLLPGRPNDTRRWPLEKLLALPPLLGLPSLLLLGPSDGAAPKEHGASILRHEKGDVRRLLALGSIAKRAGARVVGPDGGAIHVLALAGADVLVLFGPQDERRTGPIRGRTLRLEPSPPCAPCLERSCHNAAGRICMEHLSAETVASALMRSG